jgi:outer membrane protein OmpA-like peptidoglycan-associated protein
MKYLISFSTVLIINCVTVAQGYKTFPLVNPSFEGAPKNGMAPTGWIDCGFAGQTPVDIQPGFFKVDAKAKVGNTYLGMVVRDNDTYERVAQRLTFIMNAGDTYKFGAYLATSSTYLSMETIDPTAKPNNHKTPCKLRIWGGNSYCNKEELLSETQLIAHNDWRLYNFSMIPNSNYTFIILEAFYKTPVLNPYNGNILLDGMTDITWIPKNNKVLAKVEPKKKIDKPKESSKVSIEKKPDIVINKTSKFMDIDGKNLKKNQTILLEKLFFKADSTNISTESLAAVDELYDFLIINPHFKVEIGGHTNNIPKDDFCNNLSTLRAKAVVDYLITKGITADKLTYKGYGKKYPIETNSSPEGRKKNQRVEVKILSING